jgi:hypothetical protein
MVIDTESSNCTQSPPLLVDDDDDDDDVRGSVNSTAVNFFADAM